MAAAVALPSGGHRIGRCGWPPMPPGALLDSARMTFAWLAIWFAANLIGGGESLGLDPVNGWTATLILAVAIDLNRPRELSRKA